MKNAAVVRAADVRALQAFTKDYPECTATLLHRGEERLEIGGVVCVRVTEFLRELDPARPPPDGAVAG